ncbi:pyruvate kinase [Scytonema sp. NUACC21]
MQPLTRQTKVVATVNPASSRETIAGMIKAGMNVARLNFSHGSYDECAQTIAHIRSIAEELDTPITLLQDLQRQKIQISQVPENGILFTEGEFLTLVPITKFVNQPDTVAVDYPYLAKEVQLGNPVILDDGLLELKVEEIQLDAVRCKIIRGGILKIPKDANLPNIDLQLPFLSNKKSQDLDFGLSQEVDYIAVSFVRAEDVRALKNLLQQKGAANTPVVAKIEKPYAIANLEEILDECDAVMIAPSNLGVGVSQEKLPLLQKRIIGLCNHKGIPVISTIQMPESTIHNAHSTVAETSDIANAITDGTDAVMLSSESAVGEVSVEGVQMLVKIATETESEIEFLNNPPAKTDVTHALSVGLNAICKVLPPRYIVTFTSSGYTARLAAGERPKVPIIALTPNPKVYRSLNLIWGVRPVLLDREVETFEELTTQVEEILLKRSWAETDDKILIMAGIPTKHTQGTNFLKIHTITTTSEQ